MLLCTISFYEMISFEHNSAFRISHSELKLYHSVEKMTRRYEKFPTLA